MKDMLICGIDEVGRGSLAGPLVGACALFRFDSSTTMSTPLVPGLADSKAFKKESAREKVYEALLRSRHLIDFGIGECSVEEINERGITWCNNTVFQRAVMCLKQVPDVLYVDGTVPVVGWPKNKQVVEPAADARYWPVSAASIIAKVVRDRLMRELHREHPAYGWDSNKGYGSPKQKGALRELGPTRHHRTLFIRKLIA